MRETFDGHLDLQLHLTGVMILFGSFTLRSPILFKLLVLQKDIQMVGKCPYKYKRQLSSTSKQLT